MNKEQPVLFELFTLSDFKKFSSTALKNFNNYIIIMTNNIILYKNIMSVVFSFSLLFIFEFIWQAAQMNLKILSKSWESHF